MKLSDYSKESFQTRKKNQEFKHNSLHKYINQLKNRSWSSKKIKHQQTQYPFKPTISQLPFQIYPQKSHKLEISKQYLTQRLTQNKIKKQEMLKKIKIQEQETIFQKNCTFKPQINQNTSKIIKQRFKTQSSNNVYNRLYSEALEHHIFGNNLNHQQIEFSFKPTINPASFAILNQQKRNLEPIYKRLDQILKEKREKRKKVQEIQNKSQQQMLFAINNQKTKQIIQTKSQLKQYVLNRLFNFDQKKKIKLQKAVEAQKQKNQQLCPFKPTIFANNLYQGPQQFLQRQKFFQEKAKQNRLNLINEDQSTFKPQINKISQILARQYRQQQSLQEKLNRLHKQNEEKDHKLHFIAKQLYKQCTFQPKINQISKAIQCSPKNHNCKCAKKQQHYQFKPRICEKSREIVSKNHNPNKVSKEEQIQKVKMQKQYKQLIECTFKPQTKELKKKILNQGLFSAVKGVKQYMSKINQSKLKKIQQESYNQKVFNLEKKYRPKSFTKIQQFNLSEVDKYKNRQKIRKELEKKQKQQCTFHPMISPMRY